MKKWNEIFNFRLCKLSNDVWYNVHARKIGGVSCPKHIISFKLTITTFCYIGSFQEIFILVSLVSKCIRWILMEYLIGKLNFHIVNSKLLPSEWPLMWAEYVFYVFILSLNEQLLYPKFYWNWKQSLLPKKSVSLLARNASFHCYIVNDKLVGKKTDFPDIQIIVFYVFFQ